MLKTLRNAWAIPDLRKKMIFTMLMLVIFRIGYAVPVPFVNTDAMSALFSGSLNNTVLGLYNAMNGSAFSNASVLALGIQPYINASIIIQLLTVAIPALERMAKEEGEVGKKKIERITRYTTVGLSLLIGTASYFMIRTAQVPVNGVETDILLNKDVLPAFVIVLCFAAGSCGVMWLGEQITAHGIGNGISVVLFAGILAGLPDTFKALMFNIQSGTLPWWVAPLVIIVLLALVVFIVFINDAERRIPIQYAKRVVGRKIYGGQSTNLPIKVSMSGVMPVIFASTIAMVPATICQFIPGATDSDIYKYVLSNTSVPYFVVYGLLIFFFGWFYSTIQYDPVEISNNLKKNGGFIPGFRPGKPTADFIKKVINKILVFGSVYLAIVAMLPMLAILINEHMASLAIGGTSIIIVVGVALETVKALEAQMLMRHYKGFLD